MSVTAFNLHDSDGPAAIPSQLRALADEIEQQGSARTAVVVLDYGEQIEWQCLGFRPRLSATVGLLTCAAHDVMEDAEQ